MANVNTSYDTIDMMKKLADTLGGQVESYKEIKKHLRDINKMHEFEIEEKNKIRECEEDIEKILTKKIQLQNILKNTDENIKNIDTEILKKRQQLSKLDRTNLQNAANVIDLEKEILELEGSQNKLLAYSYKIKSEEIKKLDRELNIADKRYIASKREETILNSKKQLLSETEKLLGTAGNKAMTIGKNIYDAYKKGNLLGATLKLIVETLKLSVDRFIEIQQAAEEFRKTLTLTRTQSYELEKQALGLNKKYQYLGLTLKDAYGTMGDLMDVVGSTKIVENMQATTKASSLLKTNMGIASKDSIGFMNRMQAVGRITEKGSVGMAAYAKQMAKASGVPLGKIMHDVANASEETLSLIRGSTTQLIKAAAQARLLGTSLADAGKSARGFLNFQSSIEDEMEASVLVGRNLNFQLARQKAFMGDIAGAQMEAIKQIKKVGEFHKLNAFQQESVAKAAGYSVSQIQQMLKQEEALSSLDGEKLKRYRELMDIKDKEAELTGEQILADAERQNKLTKLNNSFQSLLNKLADIFVPLIDGVVTGILLIVSPIETIKDIIREAKEETRGWWSWIMYISGMASVIYPTIRKIINLFKMDISAPFKSISVVLRYMSTMVSKTNILYGFLRGISKTFGTMSGTVGGTLLKAVSKIIMPATVIYNAIKNIVSGIDKIKSGDFWGGVAGILSSVAKGFYQFFTDLPIMIVSLFSEKLGNKLKNFFGLMWDSFIIGGQDAFTDLFSVIFERVDSLMGAFSDGIVNGIKHAGKLIMEGLFWPFLIVWDWLDENFFGHSPSKLALLIVDGIKAVGEKLYEFITLPFRKGFDFIKGILPFGLGDKLFGKSQGVEISSNSSVSQNSNVNVDMSPLLEKIDELIDAHNTMMEMLKNGGIAVYMDGKKVSNAIAIASR